MNDHAPGPAPQPPVVPGFEAVQRFWQPEHFGVGGMNHFMLPEIDAVDGTAAGADRANRYGDHAMAHMIDAIVRLGAELAPLVASEELGYRHGLGAREPIGDQGPIRDGEIM